MDILPVKDFYPLKAKIEKFAESMNDMGLDTMSFTLETKPSLPDGEFKAGGVVYKCMIWREEKK